MPRAISSQSLCVRLERSTAQPPSQLPAPHAAIEGHRDAAKTYDDAAKGMDLVRDEDDAKHDSEESDSESEDDQYATSEVGEFPVSTMPSTRYRHKTYFGGTKCMRVRKLSEIHTTFGNYVEHYLDRKMQPRWQAGANQGQIKPEIVWNLSLLNALADLVIVCPDRSLANRLLANIVKNRKRRKANKSPAVTPREVWRVYNKLSGRLQKKAGAR
ncbi:hypothetical protein CKM354_000888200 [Cercospora kikuchii]|uniref:Uncharacterized protein n=1 Tax=Cercospora kikuchii TaxID=84275 RepID=A0A9P3CQJ4_9PEZI|nr:uncharacterized protein CKM354_000888200 [Cercospora kikuchii]GIZ45727.1 hypothetical protein CKM354_000888200 [Cercospora kikuchii]